MIFLDNYLCGDYDKQVLQDELTWVTVLLLSEVQDIAHFSIFQLTPLLNFKVP